MDVQLAHSLARLRARASGLSLVECLVSMLAFGIAAGLAVSLFARYGEAIRFADSHSQWTSIMIAGERMCQELREAQTLEVEGEAVEISKLNPLLFSERLDPDRPATEPMPFDAYADKYMVSVTYRVVEGELIRTLVAPQVSSSGATTTTTSSAPLTGGLSGMSLDLAEPLSTVRLSYRSASKEHQIEYLVETP